MLLRTIPKLIFIAVLASGGAAAYGPAHQLIHRSTAMWHQAQHYTHVATNFNSQ